MSDIQQQTALPASQPTEHAMLVVWGQFAQEIGLLEHLAQVPIPQKTVTHSPAAKLTTFFMGLLSGIEFLLYPKLPVSAVPFPLLLRSP